MFNAEFVALVNSKVPSGLLFQHGEFASFLIAFEVRRCCSELLQEFHAIILNAQIRENPPPLLPPCVLSVACCVAPSRGRAISSLCMRTWRKQAEQQQQQQQQQQREDDVTAADDGSKSIQRTAVSREQSRAEAADEKSTSCTSSSCCFSKTCAQSSQSL